MYMEEGRRSGSFMCEASLSVVSGNWHMTELGQGNLNAYMLGLFTIIFPPNISLM